MRGVYWGLILLVLPMFLRLVPGGDLRFAKDGLFLWSALLGIGMFGARAFKGTILTAFVAIALLTFWNQYHPYSVSVYHQSLMVMAGWSILAQGMEFTPRDWKRILPFIYASVVVQVVWLVANSLGTDPWNWVGLRRNWATGGSADTTNTIMGVLHNPSISAPLLAAMVPFLLTRWSWPLLAPALYGLYLCNSTMAWAGVLAAGVWWIARQKNGKVLVGLAGIHVLAGLWMVRDSAWASTSGRVPAWSKWGEHVGSWASLDHLLGRGVGYVHDTFRSVYRDGNLIFLQLHSEPMEVHAAWGVAGLAALAALLLQVRDRSSAWFYAFLILWVNSFGNLTFHISATTLLMILCYAKIIQSPCKE